MQQRRRRRAAAVLFLATTAAGAVPAAATWSILAVDPETRAAASNGRALRS